MSEKLVESFGYRRLEVAAADVPVESGVVCRAEPEGAQEIRCRPSTLPFKDECFSEVRSRHLIQYLRRTDAVRFLQECWRLLVPGGRIYVTAPNLQFYLDLYNSGDHELALAGLCGHQDKLLQVPQWSYTRQSLQDLLFKAGFVAAKDHTADDSSLEKSEGHLEVSAHKHAPLTEGNVEGSIEAGRQMGTRLEEIRSDHVERYHFAAQFVRPGDIVLDIACGIGYGTHLVAKGTACSRVTGIDIAPEAIDFARKHFSHERIAYLLGDCLDESQRFEPADCIISFETLEHLPRDVQFLSRLRSLLKPGGTLIISSPNEDVFPYSPEMVPYHVRHHTSAELRSLLERAAFQVISEMSQDAFQILPGFGRKFNIAVCRRNDEYVSEQFQVPSSGSHDLEAMDTQDRAVKLLLDACHNYIHQMRGLEEDKKG
ncbi:MAG: methyltransferase domain-containing protein [Armatimonadetes bacterium]|nr:methyltransferase domain-containing protein [Armatimonadota bacterium]NIO74911.1 methyltransferase domain-containing protein [Armatimonadota bacterium]NIO96612.1 methyltransferase domain-containing protein [Armatimonadota bacterium]